MTRGISNGAWRCIHKIVGNHIRDHVTFTANEAGFFLSQAWDYPLAICIAVSSSLAFLLYSNANAISRMVKGEVNPDQSGDSRALPILFRNLGVFHSKVQVCNTQNQNHMHNIVAHFELIHIPAYVLGLKKLR